MTTSARGGGEYAAVDLLAALRERGHSCVLLSNRADIADGTDVPVAPIDLGPKLARATAAALLARWPRTVRSLRDALTRQAPYDVLLVHYKKEQLLVPWLPRSLRPAVAWAEWGPVPRQLRSGPGGVAFRRAGRDVGAVLAVSEGTRRSLAAAGIPARRITVVPNAMDSTAVAFDPDARARVRAAHGIPPGAFTVGCVSRLHPAKPIDVLIAAAERLGPETHLVIAGDGDNEQRLRELARPLGPRAHFLPTPHRAIGEVLSALDVSVFCPSPTEGAPRAVIYAMLAGRPVVSTGAEGVADMISPATGSIATPDHDPEAVAALLSAYAGDPERVRREGDSGRRIAVERYGAEHVGELAERALRTAID